MRSRIFLLVIALLLCAAAREARADYTPSNDPPPPPPTYTLRWYGYQTALLDGLTGVLIGASSQAPLLGVAGYATFLVGGPIVHGVHHQDGALVASLLMRIAVPVAAGITGGYADRSCPLQGVIQGVEMGMVGTAVFDALVLGWEKHEVPAEPKTSAVLTPTLAMSARGVAAGVGGMF